MWLAHSATNAPMRVRDHVLGQIMPEHVARSRTLPLEQCPELLELSCAQSAEGALPRHPPSLLYCFSFFWRGGGPDPPPPAGGGFRGGLTANKEPHSKPEFSVQSSKL